MEHTVVVHLKLSDDGFGASDEREAIWKLQDELAEVVAQARAGKFDGEEFGQGECVFFMYGPDADALFATVQPLLKSSPHSKGGFATKRYGETSDPRAPEVRVEL